MQTYPHGYLHFYSQGFDIRYILESQSFTKIVPAAPTPSSTSTATTRLTTTATTVNRDCDNVTEQLQWAPQYTLLA